MSDVFDLKIKTDDDLRKAIQLQREGVGEKVEQLGYSHGDSLGKLQDNPQYRNLMGVVSKSKNNLEFLNGIQVFGDGPMKDTLKGLQQEEVNTINAAISKMPNSL